MQTIIQNSLILQYYDFNNIDRNLVNKIEKSKEFSQRKILFKKLLAAFLFITDQELKFIDLSSNKFQKVIDNFYLFLNENYINLSAESLRNTRYELIKWIKSLKEEIPNLNSYELNISKNDFDFQFNQEKISYIQGWFLSGKENKKKIFLNLITFYNVLGAEKTKLIHKNTQYYSSKFELETNKQLISMINEFSDFIKTKEINQIKKELESEIDLFNLIKEFCFFFFKKEEEENRVLYNSKRKWNKFVEAFKEIFLDDQILPRLSYDLPRAPSHNMKGFEKRIKIKNGIEVKSKLITEIPLNITDDIALEILFKKINSDVELTLKWANHNIKELISLYDKSFSQECFNKSAQEIKKILDSKEFLRDIKSTLLTTNALEPFMFLLINEHPQITESFLVNFELYDNNNNLSGYVKTDDNYYLIGYKKRRGADLAEQKIFL